jgi:hypothetical protein
MRAQDLKAAPNEKRQKKKIEEVRRPGSGIDRNNRYSRNPLSDCKLVL